MEGSDTDKAPTERINVTVSDLLDAAAVHDRGLTHVYLPQEGYRVVSQDSAKDMAGTSIGTYRFNSLSDDLLLSRLDMQRLPDVVQDQSWNLDFRGWLFLHFRLEGLSVDTLPDGTVHTVGGNSFLLSASREGPHSSRQVIGGSWKTVGIACRPSFIADELKIPSRSLPRELRCFQDGTGDAGFWFAGALTREMTTVATALLNPQIHTSVRPIYLRAKAVELVCLAVDRLRQPTASDSDGVKLSKYDISCMHRAHQILDESRRVPTLEELGRRVGVNRNKLAIGFKHVFGVTVGAYHRERRLNLARELLKNSNVSIARAADEAGYRDAGSFSKAFKLRFGILPSDVRS